MNLRQLALTTALSLALSPPSAIAQTEGQGVQPIVQAGGDVVQHFVRPTADADYIRREAMIPMRDGVKLYTVIIIPRSAVNAPIVLTRTPSNATARAERAQSNSLVNAGPLSDEEFNKAGYIRVWQDVRGKYKSEGDYVVTRPQIGPLNKTNVDHSTDAYDTIDWLVNKANLPESNGKVGMIGSSYEGLTVVFALLNPHPALKAAVPESPVIDAWMGDDWFHHGAFRNAMLDYIAMQTGAKSNMDRPGHGGYDDYDNFLRAGSTGDWAAKTGIDQLPFWRRLAEHPAYDEMWQGQALDKLLAANPSNIPTIWEQGLWDQEDMYGSIMAWEALKAKGKMGNNHLVMGPWKHSQVNREGRSTGPFEWDGDTVRHYWRQMVLPLFNQHLKDGPPANLPAAAIYNTGENHWDRLADWPLACPSGCTTTLTPIQLDAEGGLSFKAVTRGSDSYVSDPAKPVPFLPRPIDMDEFKPPWGTWLLTDQRASDGRQDVMTYQTDVLSEPVRVSGAPIADLFARTTGTDGDFVVKVVDVFPPENSTRPEMGGYQLAISLDIFRGRYRNSFEKPAPIPAGKVQEYKFRLPTVNHVFQPGHRIMVQVQSSLFPIYDRNPQTYVPNIFHARKSDYKAATITLERGGATPSRVWLPVVPVDQSAVMAR